MQGCSLPFRVASFPLPPEDGSLQPRSLMADAIVLVDDGIVFRFGEFIPQYE
jgi:hypothetical protein